MDARLAVGVFLVVPAGPTSPAHRRSRAVPDLGTGTRTARACAAPVRKPGTCGASPARPGRSGQRSGGRRFVVPSGHRKDLCPLGDGSGRPERRRRVDLCLPGGSARCMEQAAVGRGEMRTAEKSVGGRRNTVGEEPGSARAGCGGAREPSRRSRSRGKGEVTGHGVLEAVRRTASSGWVPWSRCVSAGRSWRPAERWPGRSPGPAGRRVAARPGRSRRRRGGPCRPTGGPRGPLWPAGGLRRPC